MTTPPLPDQINYADLAAAIALLLPGAQLRDLLELHIDARFVTVVWSDEHARRASLELHLVHNQGTYTEGGVPTPPSIGIDQTITEETR